MTMQRFMALFVATGLVIAGCTADPAETPTPSATALGPIGTAPQSTSATSPATASLVLTGDAPGAGPIGHLDIDCNLPSLDGMSISIHGTHDDPNDYFRVVITPGHVLVFEATGTGNAYGSRRYEGAGVTSFDPARGVDIDTPLVEVLPRSSSGNAPALSALTGTVDCGGQLAGTSNVALDGNVPDGPVSGRLDPVSVRCSTTPNGQIVGITGIAQVAATPILIEMNLTPDAIWFVAFVGTKTVPLVYEGTASGSVTLRPDGASVDGIAMRTKSGPDGMTLHVKGTATCGY